MNHGRVLLLQLRLDTRLQPCSSSGGEVLARRRWFMEVPARRRRGQLKAAAVQGVEEKTLAGKGRRGEPGDSLMREGHDGLQTKVGRRAAVKTVMEPSDSMRFQAEVALQVGNGGDLETRPWRL